MLWVLIFVLGFLALLTARAEPIVYDALTYRLSRVGQWLQDGHVRHFQTDDPRLNYMPVAPDLVIAWLLGATAEGFRGVALSQLMGGGLLLLATFGLARTVGLGRNAAWGAAAIVLGMGNVAAQFTAVQSDLFTAGIFAASYLLWHRAMERGECSPLGGLGMGLSLASKGTVFYLAPGALLWLAWLAWRHRRHWRKFLLTGAFAVLAIPALAGPGYLRNLQSYGSPFGPAEAVRLHHGGPLTFSGHLEKLRLNLRSSAVQLFDPTAQPWWFQENSRRIGGILAGREPATDDRFLFLHTAARRDLLGYVMAQTEPDADVVSCGLIAALLFLAGAGVACARLRSDDAARQVLIWSLGVVAYVLVQHGLVQWHQWAFRFAVLVTPWMAVVGAWGITKISGKMRLVIWTLVAVSQLQVFAVIQWRTNEDAWQAVTRPDRALAHFVYRHWRDWAHRLDDTDKPLRLAFPINHIISAFYRLSPPRIVSLEKFSELRSDTAEAAVGESDAWLLVPVNRFKGREGRVFARTWLFNGEPDKLYGVAAYRRLGPAESPVPVAYRSSRMTVGNDFEYHMTVRAWSTPLRVRLRNNGSVPWNFTASLGNGVWPGTIPVDGEVVLEIPVNPETLNELVFRFEGPPSDGGERIFPRVELLP